MFDPYEHKKELSQEVLVRIHRNLENQLRIIKMRIEEENRKSGVNRMVHRHEASQVAAAILEKKLVEVRWVLEGVSKRRKGRVKFSNC